MLIRRKIARGLRRVGRQLEQERIALERLVELPELRFQLFKTFLQQHEPSLLSSALFRQKFRRQRSQLTDGLALRPPLRRDADTEIFLE